jgi:hypothetical protein
MKSREEAAWRVAGYASGFYEMSTQFFPRDIRLHNVSIDADGKGSCEAKGRNTASHPNGEDELVAIIAGLLANGLRTNDRWSNLSGLDDTGPHGTRIEELLRGGSLPSWVGKTKSYLWHCESKIKSLAEELLLCGSIKDGKASDFLRRKLGGL